MIDMNILSLNREHNKTSKATYEKYQQKYITEYKQIHRFFKLNNVCDKFFKIGLYIDLMIIDIKNHYKDAGDN